MVPKPLVVRVLKGRVHHSSYLPSQSELKECGSVGRRTAPVSVLENPERTHCRQTRRKIHLDHSRPYLFVLDYHHIRIVGRDRQYRGSMTGADSDLFYPCYRQRAH